MYSNPADRLPPPPPRTNVRRNSSQSPPPPDLNSPTMPLNLSHSQFSPNPMAYSSPSAYPTSNPHHLLPSQPGMSRRSTNSSSWNDNSNNSYNHPPASSGPHGAVGHHHPPRLHFSVQVPGNPTGHQFLETLVPTHDNGPGPGSPMNATPTYPHGLSGNPSDDQQNAPSYLSSRSPQMSPRVNTHHQLQQQQQQQQQLGTSAYSAGVGSSTYTDPGVGPSAGSSRGMAYSPSQYALHSINHSNSQTHIGPSSAAASASLLPQHHTSQPSMYSTGPSTSANLGYMSHPGNPASTLPPPPATYSNVNPNPSPYFTPSSSSSGLPPPASTGASSSRHSFSQSNQPSSSLSSSSEQYYASRSASGASSQRPRRTTEGMGFRRLPRGANDLRPVLNSVPADRRLDPINGGYISPLKALTIHLASTYRLINPNFRYELSLNPRRVLTKPSKPAGNNGMDNEDSDYILYVNDILGGGNAGEGTGEAPEGPGGRSTGGHKYLILDVLGQGTFGQVVKCQDMKTHQVVAVKVVKNKQAYFSQSMMEVTILELVCHSCFILWNDRR